MKILKNNLKLFAFVAIVLGTACVLMLSGFHLPTFASLAVLLFAIGCDDLTTYLCLKKSGREGNPIAAFLMKKAGIKGTIIIMACIWGVIIYTRWLPSQPSSQTAIAFAYLLVPINNLWVLRRLTKIQNQKRQLVAA